MTQSNVFAPELLTIYQIEELYSEWCQGKDGWQVLDLSNLTELDAAGLQFAVSLLKQNHLSLELKWPTEPHLAECIQHAFNAVEHRQGEVDD